MLYLASSMNFQNNKNHIVCATGIFVKKISVVCMSSFVLFSYVNHIFADETVKIKESEKYTLDSKFRSGIRFRALDENFRAKFGTLVQIDGISLNTNKAILNENTGVRRSRLILDMHFYKNWEVMVMYDVAVRPLDLRGFQYLLLRYNGISRTRLTFGNIQEPIGLDWSTSTQEVSFLERAQMTSLLPPLHLGFLVETYGDLWSYGVGVFAGEITDGFHFKNNWGASSRFTYSPIRNDDTVVHLGVSGSYRDQLGVINSPSEIPDTGSSNAEAVRFSSSENLSFYNQLLGAEVALRKGYFTAQFEYLRNFKNKEPGIPEIEYDSWYVQGVWILTGEVRNYNPVNGTFGSINPIKKSSSVFNTGAWEFGVRYSEINNTKGENVLTYDNSNLTVGLNWHLSKNIRIMTNYIRVKTNRSEVQSDGKKYANVIGTRIQINF